MTNPLEVATELKRMVCVREIGADYAMRIWKYLAAHRANTAELAEQSTARAVISAARQAMSAVQR